jgi:germination protein M
MADMKRFSIAVLILVAAVVAGCTPTPAPPVVGPGPSVPTSPSVPASSTTQPTTPTPPPASPVMVKVYFSIDAERIQPFLRELPAGTQATLKGALEELLKGPNASESAAGFISCIPNGTVLRSVKISGTTAIVDFDSEYESGGGTASVSIRLEQVIYTATQFPTVKDVKFLIDGKTVKIFSGEGFELDGPQTRADATYATPAIFVDTPAWKATVTNGMTARGTADVFEAVFRLQLRDSAGTLIVDKLVQATSGTGTRGTWSQKLNWSSAQAGVGELKVFAKSAKDGKTIEVVKVPVVISE